MEILKINKYYTIKVTRRNDNRKIIRLVLFQNKLFKNKQLIDVSFDGINIEFIQHPNEDFFDKDEINQLMNTCNDYYGTRKVFDYICDLLIRFIE